MALLGDEDGVETEEVFGGGGEEFVHWDTGKQLATKEDILKNIYIRFDSQFQTCIKGAS